MLDESAKVKRVERPKAYRPIRPHRRLDARQRRQVFVAEGEQVAKGQALAVTQAMKVEQTIQAPRAGTVMEVAIKAGDSIQAGDLLFVVEPDEG